MSTDPHLPTAANMGHPHRVARFRGHPCPSCPPSCGAELGAFTFRYIHRAVMAIRSCSAVHWVVMPPRAISSPELYLNRSLSWLAFNRRVLEEAEDESNPLLERVKFLAITASNLDEFFEIRIAGLLQHLEEGQVEAGPDGLTPIDRK